MGNGKVGGKVKFYSRQKGYGFIRPDDGSRDVFVHAKELPEGIIDLIPDQRVKYHLQDHAKGPRALSIDVTPPAHQDPEKTGNNDS